MSRLKQDLIAKAKRDLSKLVKVKRTVNKKGSTFTQSFYIRPDQVKPTDRILSNKDVLDAYLKAHSQTPLTSLTKDLIDQVNAEVDTKGKLELLKNSLGKENTINYFQKLGVTWKTDTDPRINWMRANMAIQKYLKANKLEEGNSNGSTVELIKSDIEDVLKLTSTKDQVAKLKELLGKEGVIAYLKEQGFTWKEDTDPRINWMRANMSLQKHLKSGGALQPSKVTVGNTQSPKPKDDKTDTKVDDKTDTKADDKADNAPKIDDKLEDDHELATTPQKKNMIKFINSIEDEGSLIACTVAGMVPEDDVAKDFIVNKLSGHYEDFKSHLKKQTGGLQSDPDPELVNAEMMDVSTSAVNMVMSANALKKSRFAYTYVKTSLNEIYPGRIIDPATLFYHSYDVPELESNRNTGDSRSLTYTFGLFDDYGTYGEPEKGGEAIVTNLPRVGYTGFDTKKSEEEFDLDKEGFIQLLDHIAKEQPELKNACEDKKEKYSQLMEICKGNKQLLKLAIALPITGESFSENCMLKPDYKGGTLPQLPADTGTYDFGSYMVRLGRAGSRRGYTPLEALFVPNRIFDFSSEDLRLIKNVPLTLDMVDFLKNYLEEAVKTVGGTNEEFMEMVSETMYRYNCVPMEREPGLTTMSSPQSKADSEDLTGKPIFAFKLPYTDYPFNSPNAKYKDRKISGQDIFRDFVKKFEEDNKITLTERQKRTMLGFMNNNIGFLNDMVIANYIEASSDPDIASKKVLAEGSYDYLKNLTTMTNEDLGKAKSLLCDIFSTEVTSRATGEVLKGDDLVKYFSTLNGPDKARLDYHTKTDNKEDLATTRNLMMANTLSSVNQTLRDLSKYGSKGKGGKSWATKTRMGSDLKQCTPTEALGYMSYSKRFSNNPSWDKLPVRHFTHIEDRIQDKENINLSFVPTFSAEWSEKIKPDVLKRGDKTAPVYKMRERSNYYLDGASPTGVEDIIYSLATSIASEVRESKYYQDSVKIKEGVAKKLKPKFKASVEKNKGTSPGQRIKTLRENLLRNANCSLKTEDHETSSKMAKEFMKRWDYSKDNSTPDPDGTVRTVKQFDGRRNDSPFDRRALLNSRFFKINNSSFEEGYNKYKSNAGDRVKEWDLFHASSYHGTAGIIGVDGKWRMGADTSRTGLALGPGAYFGFTGGKSAVYCGSDYSGTYYNLKSKGADGDKANGCYILTNVLLDPSKRGSDFLTDRGRFQDFEVAVKKNECMLPHHIVDVSSRSLGVNVDRDDQGNYINRNGTATHNKYGVSLTLKSQRLTILLKNLNKSNKLK